jgi:quercetin dioxygenase-like cupin family protein
MKIANYKEIKEEIPKEEGVKDATIRWLITKEDGAENFAMRLFSLKPDGYTPLHSHDWEHEVFIVNGSGELKDGKTSHSFKKGDTIFVNSNEMHQFVNTEDEELQFICIIPYKD